jgi:hypothetical protein
MTKLSTLVDEVCKLDDEKRFGLDLSYQLIEGEVDVAEVSITDREELPIFLTIADDQILCICYLWSEDEVRPESRAEMMEIMLDMNVPMPLSSFAKIENKYVVFGAMSLNSSTEDVALEIATLSENAIDAITTMKDYLK